MNNEKEKNYEYVRLALPLMSKYNIPITPRNYAVWYKYVSGESDKLKTTIDMMVEKNEIFNNEKNENLYLQFCAEKNEEDLTRFRQGLQKILETILKEIMDITGQTEQYETVVSKSISKLSGTISDENIMSVINEIIDETRAMGAHGKHIQKKLNETRQNLKTIQQQFEEAKTAALVDFLTGIPNRKALDEKFTEYSAEAVPEEKDLCLLLIDIDLFKKFNDKFGHVTGDEVLKYVAKKNKGYCKRTRFFCTLWRRRVCSAATPYSSFGRSNRGRECKKILFRDIHQICLGISKAG